MIRNTALALATLLASQTLLANTASPRIVGGKDADAGWKNLVALISKSAKEYAVNNEFDNPVFQAQFCGGTLLSEEWVLTAAHCVTGEQSSDIEIMVGSQTLNIAPSSDKLLDVQSIHIHPGYNSATDRNDIALIRLSELADPSLSSVSTAVLALPGTDQELEALLDNDDVMTALGWGVVTYDQLDEDPALEPVFTLDLQEVGLDYVSNSDCQNLYDNNANSETIYDSMLCANEPDPDAGDTFGEDSCQGDSGGPLFITAATLNDSPQAGITSFGYNCGDFNVPGVYSRVSKFLGWIEQTTNINGIALRNLTIGETAVQNQGVGNFPLNIPVKNIGSNSATNFSLAIQHSWNLSLTPALTETGLDCTNPSSTLTQCEYTGPSVAGNSTQELAFSANDSSARSTGSEILNVTVTLDKYRDYHRLDDNGTVPIYFGTPTLNITAEPFCLNPGSSSVQMRVEATLGNSSAQLYSEGTIVTGTLPEGLTLVGNASPSCTLEDDLFTCTVGQLNAGEEKTAIVAVTAAPDTLQTLEVEVDNDNGLSPSSNLSASVELDFSREDLPTCPAIPTPVSNLTGSGSSGGGGGSTSLSLLGLLALLGLRRKR